MEHYNILLFGGNYGVTEEMAQNKNRNFICNYFKNNTLSSNGHKNDVLSKNTKNGKFMPECLSNL